MGKTVMAILVLFSTWAFATSARADFKTGEELYGLCMAPDDVRGHSFCVGYVAAIADVLGAGTGTISDWRACIPAKATQGEVATIAIEWLREHPDNRAFGASNVIAQALANRYPCSR
ncbi:MAG: Rap1a/Tai family immunity protein [Gammaproteobacteria bacterium]